jgi:diguanylate cyclase (GGDEF)-like protein
MSDSLTILICDHRGAGVTAHVPALERAGFEVEVATTLRQTLDRARVLRPTVLMVDPLSNVQGAEVEAVDRAGASRLDSALLLIVDPQGDAPSSPGAPVAQRPWDFVRRDAPAEELLARVARLREQLLREREIERLRHLATHDDRTDLLRPQVFQDQVRAHFSAAQRHGFDLALLLIDLDDFGRVNKVHDHTVGDRVITRVGNIIRGALRVEDVAGRLGGDEFAVLLPYTRKYDAARVARRLLDQIREVSSEILPQGSNIAISASIGFETCDGHDVESVERLRLNAEEALHRAKREGGDRAAYFRQPEDDSSAKTS